MKETNFKEYEQKPFSYFITDFKTKDENKESVDDSLFYPIIQSFLLNPFNEIKNLKKFSPRIYNVSDDFINILFQNNFFSVFIEFIYQINETKDLKDVLLILYDILLLPTNVCMFFIDNGILGFLQKCIFFIDDEIKIYSLKCLRRLSKDSEECRERIRETPSILINLTSLIFLKHR